jgi:hypothetical protein
MFFETIQILIAPLMEFCARARVGSHDIWLASVDLVKRRIYKQWGP